VRGGTRRASYAPWSSQRALTRTRRGTSSSPPASAGSAISSAVRRAIPGSGCRGRPSATSALRKVEAALPRPYAVLRQEHVVQQVGISQPRVVVVVVVVVAKVEVHNISPSSAWKEERSVEGDILGSHLRPPRMRSDATVLLVASFSLWCGFHIAQRVLFLVSHGCWLLVSGGGGGVFSGTKAA
jgi:hypothetical protein